MPQIKDWNNFWFRKESRAFTEISWSKRRIMALLSNYLEPGLHVLDAGCGSGFFTSFFCDNGASATGLDYSAEALGIAGRKTKDNARLIQADLLAAELPEIVGGKYHVIFSDGLFEHFSSEQQDCIFKNLKSLLTDNGYIITYVPNRWSPWELIRPFYMPGIEEKPFVMSGLIDLHQRNGLKVVRSGGINVLPFRFSPDKSLGRYLGMLLFVIAKKEH